MSKTFDAIYEQHRGHLWGLCYRITGSGNDADDLVQDTFARALERPPADLAKPWRPWLARVATNLAIDALRRRRAREYVGPWLPEPADTAVHEPAAVATEVANPEARYDLVQSATFAFLVALEALDATQRAVLVLRDVMGYTGPQVAGFLATTPANARVVLHRARKKLEAYDSTALRPTPALAAKTASALQALMFALATNDLDAARACLSPDVIVSTDGGGVYSAATREVRGIDAAIKLLHGLNAKSGARLLEARAATLNGGHALVLRFEPNRPRAAPLVAVLAELDATGRITAVRSVSAPDKIRPLQ